MNQNTKQNCSAAKEGADRFIDWMRGCLGADP